MHYVYVLFHPKTLFQFDFQLCILRLYKPYLVIYSVSRNYNLYKKLQNVHALYLSMDFYFKYETYALWNLL